MPEASTATRVSSMLGTSLILAICLLASLAISLLGSLGKYAGDAPTTTLGFAVAASAVGLAPAGVVLAHDISAWRGEARHPRADRPGSTWASVPVAVAFLVVESVIWIPVLIGATSEMVDAFALQRIQESYDTNEIRALAEDELTATALALELDPSAPVLEQEECDLAFDDPREPAHGVRTYASVTASPGQMSFDELAARFAERWTRTEHAPTRETVYGVKSVDAYDSVALIDDIASTAEVVLVYESVCFNPS